MALSEPALHHSDERTRLIAAMEVSTTTSASAAASSLNRSDASSTERPLLDAEASQREDERQPPIEQDGNTPSSPSFVWTQRIYLSLAVSVALGLVSGTLYGYGRYSKDLKDTLDLTHFQLERLGILLDTGNYFGHPIVGYVYDHWGPRVSCWSGALIVFGSYNMIHWSIRNARASTVDDDDDALFDDNDASYSLWGLGICFLLVGFGSGMGYTSALGSTTKNFRNTPFRSLSIGVVASGYGLPSTLVGLSYTALGLRHFFLFWALLASTVNLLGSAVLGRNTQLQQQQQSEAHSLEDVVEEVEGGSDGSATLPEQDEAADSEHDSFRMEPLPSDEREARDVPTSSQQPKWEAVRSADFWLLFAAFACCTGCGLFVINNVSTMVQSIGGNDLLTNRLVILLSFSNCAGRILMGSMADRHSKLTLFGISSATMAVALFLSAGTNLQHSHVCLVVTIMLVAVSYGGVWVLIVGILSDWFGTSDFGKNYGLIAMGPALSGMIFNETSAWLYQMHTTRSGEDSNTCSGTVCYRGSFLLTGTAATLCSILLVCLAFKRVDKPAIMRE